MQRIIIFDEFNCELSLELFAFNKTLIFNSLDAGNAMQAQFLSLFFSHTHSYMSVILSWFFVSAAITLCLLLCCWPGCGPVIVVGVFLITFLAACSFENIVLIWRRAIKYMSYCLYKFRCICENIRVLHKAKSRAKRVGTNNILICMGVYVYVRE